MMKLGLTSGSVKNLNQREIEREPPFFSQSALGRDKGTLNSLDCQGQGRCYYSIDQRSYDEIQLTSIRFQMAV